MARLWALAFPVAGLLTLGLAPRPAPPTAPVRFHEEVEPILKAECSGCHGKDLQSGGFSLETPALLRKGGAKFGAKIVVPGRPEQSALIGYLSGKHQPQMPVGRPPLSPHHQEIVARWIAQGARIDPPVPTFPYAPPKVGAPPRLRNVVLATEWVRSPLDAFVLAGLEKKGLTPSPPADRATLIRRVTYDLIGLPPAPEDVDAFVRDTAPDAYERVVDRLLADPRYGERWARHWLDLVRYAETHGFEADNIRPRAWRYRDWVIRSLNADKPYDRFVMEQLAGDELWPDDSEALIATGFLRLGAFDELARDDAGRRQDALNDATDTIGAGMLGMTLGCARCHDHKYDRISMVDYYRIQACLSGAVWSDARLPRESDPPALVARRTELQSRRDAAQKVADALRAEARAALLKPKADDGEVERWLDGQGKERRRRFDEARRDIDAAGRDLAPLEPVAEAMVDRSAAPPTHKLLRRGSLASPGEALTPGFIASLCGTRNAEATLTKPARPNSSGARAALARWIADPENPLTARVIVNRVWQHHFGEGIVATPSDFGFNGGKPSHPELLDWLARDLVRGGWSLKKLHRTILTSATYRQSVGVNARAAKVDPENRLLWRQRRQRLEGEAIRDAILATAGRLNPEQGGPSVYPEVSAEVLATGSTHKWGRSPEDQQRRRSVYVFQRRSLGLPITEVFDGPDMVNTCPRRARTTIAPQALALFNGRFGRDEAGHFARRVASESGVDPAARVERAYRLALGRRPTAAERDAAVDFLRAKSDLHRREGRVADPALAALADFCHVLYNTNEFLYVD